MISGFLDSYVESIETSSQSRTISFSNIFAIMKFSMVFSYILSAVIPCQSWLQQCNVEHGQSRHCDRPILGIAYPGTNIHTKLTR